MVALSLISLLLAPAVLAVPAWRRDGNYHGQCSVPTSALDIPAAFDQLSYSPNFVLMGFGIQNYTCNDNGSFDSIGAIGQMFDISCAYGTPEFKTIQNDAYNIWNSCPEMDPLNSQITQEIENQFNVKEDGQHYFSLVNGVLEAVWDLTSSGQYAGDPNAIVYAHKINSVTSPDGSYNIDWVELTADAGDLAKTLYRINTVAGQPPSSCNPGDATSVKYATKYVLN